MKIIDNTPIENFNIDWGDPDGTGMKEKSKEQVQKFIKKKFIGLGYTYIGTATPSTTPIEITAEDKVFYIAVEAGDYTNFEQFCITNLTIFKSEEGRWVAEGLNIPLNLIKKEEETMDMAGAVVGIYEASKNTKDFRSTVTNFKTLDVQVQEGEKYKICSSVGGVSSAQVIFWDVNGYKVSLINQGSGAYLETEFVVPSGAVEMSVCGQNGYTFQLYRIVEVHYDFADIAEKSEQALENSLALAHDVGEIENQVNIMALEKGFSKWFSKENYDTGLYCITSSGRVTSTEGTSLWSCVVKLTKGVPFYLHGGVINVALFSEYPAAGSQSNDVPISGTYAITIIPKEGDNYAMITTYDRYGIYAEMGESYNDNKVICSICEDSYEDISYVTGYARISSTGYVSLNSNNECQRTSISVQEGEIYKYRSMIPALSDAYIIMFADANSLVIGAVGRYEESDSGKIVSGIIQVPAGATQMFLNSKSVYEYPYLTLVNNYVDLQLELSILKNRVNDTEKVFDVIELTSKNLYHGEYIDRGYIAATNGALSYADGYAATALIPILPNRYYYLSNRAKGAPSSIRCLDANNNVMKVLAAGTGTEYPNNYYLPTDDCTGATTNGQFKTPLTAAYIQITIKGPNVTSDTFNNIMLEDVGDVYDPTFEPSPYEPYNLKATIKEEALPEGLMDDVEELIRTRKSPRILLIGSSHGMNTISQVPWMFYKNGYDDVYIGNVYVGSFMIQELAQRIALGTSLPYQAFKDGGWGKDKGSLTMNNLLNKEWDVIILQRSAATCTQWDVDESTSFGYVVDYITQYVKTHNLKTPRILFNSGFADGKAGTTEQIMTTALQCKEEYGVKIIPNAYAMANARNTWLKEIGTTGYLCYDNQHLDYGIGCWVAGACVYEAVMRPLGESVECVSGYGTLAEQIVFTSSAEIEGAYTEPTEETMRIAKDCVLAAFNKNEINSVLAAKYQYKNRVYVFPGWATVAGMDINTKCVEDGGSYSVTFEIWNGAYFDDSVEQPVVVMMGDTDITSSSYTQDSDDRGGSINISNVTDDIYIVIRTTRNPINPPE